MRTIPYLPVVKCAVKCIYKLQAFSYNINNQYYKKSRMFHIPPPSVHRNSKKFPRTPKDLRTPPTIPKTAWILLFLYNTFAKNLRVILTHVNTNANFSGLLGLNSLSLVGLLLTAKPMVCGRLLVLLFHVNNLH